MRTRSILAALTWVMLTTPAAYGLDHKNLDEGRPLRLEDAYPIASGELAVEAGAGFTLGRRSADRGVFAVEILYGAVPNLQLGLGTTPSTDPRSIDEQTKSGDLQIGALYNFNQETLTLPALGLKLTVNLPTGVNSSGVDVEVKGIVTKSVGRLSLHLNAAYEFIAGEEEGEREGQYEFALGSTYPVGAPRYTRTTLVGDVFTHQAVRSGDSNVVGVEFGFRHQLTPQMVVDAGIGTEFAGPAERSCLFFTSGLSFAF